MSLSYIKVAGTLHWKGAGGGGGGGGEHLCRILTKVKQAQCVGAKGWGDLIAVQLSLFHPTGLT